VNLFSDSVTVTGRFRASVVPAVLRRFSLRESCSTGVTEQLRVFTVVLVKLEFEF